MPEYPVNGFENPQHAYAAGSFMGLAAKHGLELKPVIEEGSWTNRFEVIGLSEHEGDVRVFVAVEAPVERRKIHG